MEQQSEQRKLAYLRFQHEGEITTASRIILFRMQTWKQILNGAEITDIFKEQTKKMVTDAVFNIIPNGDVLFNSQTCLFVNTYN